MFAATEVERPVSPSRFFYSPSAPDSMYLDLPVPVDDQDEPFKDGQKRPSLKIPYTESLREAQDSIDTALDIQALYPGLQISEMGLSWNNYGFSFLLDNTNHLWVTEQQGIIARSSILRLFNPRGAVTVVGLVNLSTLRAKAHHIFLSRCQGRIESLLLSTTGEKGELSIDQASSLTVKTLTVSQGTLHNSGNLSIEDNGVLDSGTRSVANDGSIHMGDHSTLRAKAIANQRSRRAETSPFPAGRITGKGVASLDIGTFVNLGEVKLQTIQGRIHKLTNFNHFEALESFNNLIILDLLNEAGGRILGDGALTLTGTNRGLIQGKSLLLNVKGEFTNAEFGHLYADDLLETRGTGSFLQRGQMRSLLFTINNARFENFADVLQEQMALRIGENVTYWKNHEKAHLKTKSMVLNKSSLTSTVFSNEGTLETGQFLNHRAVFRNSGQMTLRKWRQYGHSFSNLLGGEIRVLELFTGDTNTLENEGDLHFEREVEGQILQLINRGGLFFKGKTTLIGRDILNHKLIRATALFNWLGETVDNQGSLYLDTFKVRGRFLNNGAAEVKTLILEKLKELQNTGTLCVTGEMSGEAEAFTSSGTLTLAQKSTLTGGTLALSGLVKADKGFEYQGQTLITREKEKKDINKATLELKGSHRFILSDPVKLLGTIESEGDLTLKAPSIENHGTLTHSQGTVTIRGALANHGDIDLSHLVYLSGWLKNDNKMHIRYLETPTVLRTLINEKGSADAVLVIYKGNVGFERISNQSKLVLADGIYTFYESLEENLGEILIDAELVLLDRDYTLKGSVSVKKLRADLKTKTLRVDGKVSIESGGFDASHVDITSSGQLALANGTYKTKTWTNNGLLLAQPKMKLSADEFCYQKAIESNSGLRVLALALGEKAQSKEDDTPTIMLSNLKETHKLLERLTLREVKVKGGDLTIEFPHGWDIAWWLYIYGSKWQHEGALVLYGDRFDQDKAITRGGALKLFVKRYQNKRHTLTANALDIEADEFDIGTDNDTMAMIQTVADPKVLGPQDNHLTLTRKGRGDLDLRFTSIAGWGETTLSALDGDVVMGHYRMPYGNPGWYTWNPNRRVYTLINNGDGACLASFLPLAVAMNVSWVGQGHILGINDEEAYFDAFKEFKKVKNGAFVTSPERVRITAPNGDININYGIVESFKGIEIEAKNKVRSVAGALQAPDVQLSGRDFEQIIDGLGCLPFFYETAFFPMSDRSVIDADNLRLKFQNYLTYGSEIIARKSFSYFGKDGQEIRVPWISGKIEADTFKEFSADCYFYCRGPGSSPDATLAVGNLVCDKERLARLLQTPWSDEFRSLYYPVNSLQWHNFALAPIRHSGATSTVVAKKQVSQASVSAGAIVMYGGQIFIIGSYGAQYKKQARPGRHSTYPVIQDRIRNNGIYQTQLDGTVRSPYLKDTAFIPSGQEPVWGRSRLGIRPVYRIYAEANLVKSALFKLMAVHMGRIHDEGRYGDDLVEHTISYSQQQALLGAFTSEERLKKGHRLAVFFQEMLIEGKPLAVIDLFIPKAKVDEDAGLPGHKGVDADINAGGVHMERVKMRMDHDLNVTATTSDITMRAVRAKAGHDVKLNAAQNLVTEAVADRRETGFNSYADHKAEMVIEAGNDLEAHAGLDAYRKGAVMKAGRNMNLSAARRIIDESLALAQQNFSQHGRDWTLERIINQSVSEYEAGGGFTQTAGVGQVLQAIHVKSGEKPRFISGAEGIQTVEAHNEYYFQSHTEGESGGLFGGGKSSESVSRSHATSVAMVVESPEEAEFISLGGDITLGPISLQVPKTILRTMGGVVRLLLGTNHSAYSRVASQSDMFFQSQSMRKEEHHTFTSSDIPGEVEVHARELLVEQVRGQTLDWLERIEKHGFETIQTSWREEIHHVESHEVSGITPALGALIALAVSVATAGSDMGMGSTLISGLGVTNATAAAFISGVTSAAFASVCAQGAIAMINHNGNVGKALKDLTSPTGIKQIMMAAASGGLADMGMGKALAGFTVGVATGEKPGDAALSAARLAVASTLQAALATQIGVGGYNFVAREIMHGASGAAAGMILNGDAAAGAISAMVSTAVTHVVKDTPKAIGERALAKARADGSPTDMKSLQPYIQEEIRGTIDMGRLSGAVATFLSGHDVAVGIEVATTAVVNNCAATMERQVFETSALKEALQEAAEAVPEFMTKLADVIEENPDAVETGAEVFMGAFAFMGEDRGTKAPKTKAPHQAKADGVVKKGLVSAVRSGAKALREGAQKLKASTTNQEGGLNLFKWKDKTSKKATGWKEGDHFLYLPYQGGPKADWKQNAGRLREAMRENKPIYDSFRTPVKGTRRESKGFLRAERHLLESRGWVYNVETGSYHPPKA